MLPAHPAVDGFEAFYWSSWAMRRSVEEVNLNLKLLPCSSTRTRGYKCQIHYSSSFSCTKLV